MNIFKVPVKVPKRNKFDLSHDFKASGKMGRLYPVLAMDANPNEDWSIAVESKFRFLPMVAEPMHKVKIKLTTFFVPNRILCPTWEKFILADDSIGDEPIAPPTIQWKPVDQFASFTIGGYMGLPGMPSGTNEITVSAYPFAAYARIYQEYYRPQHLEDENLQDLLPGDNPWAKTIAIGGPYSTNWSLDYFTSALPYPQWGAEAVRIPVGEMPVVLADGNIVQKVRPSANHAGTIDGGIFSDAGTLKKNGGAYESIVIDPNGSYVTDPNSAGTIDDLLRANALQNWLRRTARAGNRYVEQIKAVFGGAVQDHRLQRPEFVGTIRQTVQFSEVLSTAETDAPLGTVAGQGKAYANSAPLRYKTREHGWFIMLMTVMPTSAYQDGVARKWLRQDRFDYAFPDFANIGEQPVYNAEIFADVPVGSGTGQQRGTWAYQSRYCEYKNESSRVAGLLRNTLDHWHLGRKFQQLPALNQNFVQTYNDHPSLARIFADTNGEHFVFHIYFQIQAWRPLPRFGVPAL